MVERMDPGPDRVEFEDTQWSVISAARGDASQAGEALERFAVSYSAPLRAYVAALCGANDADDLVQEFFAQKVLSRNLLRSARRGAGSFRAFLKLCVRRFVIDRQDPARRRRAPGDAPADVRLDADAAVGVPSVELVAREPAADIAMDRAWLRQLLGNARARLGAECRETGQADLFVEFGRVLDGDPEALSYHEIGRRLGLSEDAVKTRFWRYRERLKALFNEEIRQTVGSREEMDRERAQLLRTFQDPPAVGGA